MMRWHGCSLEELGSAYGQYSFRSQLVLRRRRRNAPARSTPFGTGPPGGYRLGTITLVSLIVFSALALPSQQALPSGMPVSTPPFDAFFARR